MFSSEGKSLFRNTIILYSSSVLIVGICYHAKAFANRLTSFYIRVSQTVQKKIERSSSAVNRKKCQLLQHFTLVQKINKFFLQLRN